MTVTFLGKIPPAQRATIVLGSKLNPSSANTLEQAPMSSSQISTPPPPQRKDFKTQEDFEEAIGFWQSRVGRLRGLAGVSKTALSPNSPETSGSD